MTLTTPVCQLLGIRLPIVQGPIGSATTPELAAGVSNGGGLGMLAVTWLSPATVAERIRRTRQQTSAPFGINLCLDFPVDEKLEVGLGHDVKIVSTFWGDPGPVHERIHAAGALHMHTVGSVEEARAAVDVGVDAVVAQGWEAGGHVWGHVATLPLVPAVVDAVAPVPVIAAGGVADGRGLAAVLMLGAQAAWLGTRFLTATEAATHDHYRSRVVAAASTDAVYTTCFDGGWARAPHRVLRNDTLSAWEHAGYPAAPHRPGEGVVVAWEEDGHSCRRYDDMMPLRGSHGDVDEMALYAGQSAGLVTDIRPAADIVASIVTDAERLLAAAVGWPYRTI